MRTRLSLTFAFCSSLVACGDGGGSSSPSDAGSSSAEDAGTPDAGETEDYTDLSAALLAKYEECDYREPDLRDADYTVEDSFDACLARCRVEASCDELKATACDPAAGGAVGECLDACQPSLSLPGGFVCGNGRSIPHDFLCDLEADCADGEDEEGCGTFTCDSGRVLPARSVRCDQHKDCADGSDEAGCKLSC
jgi:Low-density lipoprotein receptor domain class A